MCLDGPQTVTADMDTTHLLVPYGGEDPGFPCTS